jgi:zinc D-Ala-D-Ala carboxypeptidase
MPAADTPHFKISELLCPHCDRGADMIQPALMAALERVRERFGKPMPVDSGYRCAVHNIEIKGARFSAHREGKAADIADPKGELAALLTETVCADLGIWIEDPRATRGWVHITIRPAASRIFWPSPAGGLPPPIASGG